MNGLEAIVLEQLREQPQTVMEIHARLESRFGSEDLRAVWDALSGLERQGKVQSLGAEELTLVRLWVAA